MRSDSRSYEPGGGLTAPGAVDTPPAHVAHWEPRWPDARTHRIPVRIYRPGAHGYGRLVWAHGASWQAGSVEHGHEPVMDLTRVSGCTVVSIGYRPAFAIGTPPSSRTC